MGLAILGAVPHVDWHNGNREESAGQVIEALRGIRLSVANRHGGAGPVVVTVTSPGRSDGKSFAASNLALARSEEHTPEPQSQSNPVCRLLLEKKIEQTTKLLQNLRRDASRDPGQSRRHKQ